MAKLADRKAKALISARLLRVAAGILGDTVMLGGDVSELRVHFGPGYRIYFLKDGATVVVLLCGGDKGSQQRDIETAHRLAREWRCNHG